MTDETLDAARRMKWDSPAPGRIYAAVRHASEVALVANLKRDAQALAEALAELASYCRHHQAPHAKALVARSFAILSRATGVPLE